MHTSLTVLTHALEASSTGSTSSGKGSSFLPFLVLIALFGVAYFAFLRPARNRQRATVAQRRAADVGDEITTTAGLIARVVAVDDDEITLEVAPGVHCRYLPAAILRVNGDDDAPEPDDAEADRSNHEVIEEPEAAHTDPMPTQHDAPPTPPETTITPTRTESTAVPLEPLEPREPLKPHDPVDGTTDNPGGSAPA